MVGRGQPLTAADDLLLHADGDKQRHLLAYDIAGETGRRYTDDGEWITIQANRLANHGWRERELALPISVTQNGNGVGVAGGIVGVREQAAGSGGETEKREIVPADQASIFLLFGGFILRSVHFNTVLGSGSGESGENGIVIAQFFIKRVRKDVDARSSVGTAVHKPCVADHNELLRILYRQHLQEECIYDGKDGGVSADSEGQCEDGNNRETGTFAELPDRVMQILKDRSHHSYLRATMGSTLLARRAGVAAAHRVMKMVKSAAAA